MAFISYYTVSAAGTMGTPKKRRSRRKRRGGRRALAGELGPSHHLLNWTDRLDLLTITARTALPGTVCIYRVVLIDVVTVVWFGSLIVRHQC